LRQRSGGHDGKSSRPLYHTTKPAADRSIKRTRTSASRASVAQAPRHSGACGPFWHRDCTRMIKLW
jgi:hypothetical protein